jgi:hypothetical protein
MGDKEHVEEFLANLMIAGFNREWASVKAYEYALTLQTDREKEGAYVSSSMMMQASELVKSAIPGAQMIYERRFMMR